MAKAKRKLTTNDVARAVGATPKTICRYADRGEIPCETARLGANYVRLFDPSVIPTARALLKKNVAAQVPKRV